MKLFFYSVFLLTILVSCSRVDLPLKGSKEALAPKISLANGAAFLDESPIRIGKILPPQGSVKIAATGYVAFGFDGKNTIYFAANTQAKFSYDEKSFHLAELSGFFGLIRPTESGTTHEKELSFEIGQHKVILKNGSMFVNAGIEKPYIYLFKGEAIIDGEPFQKNSAYEIVAGKLQQAPVNLHSAARFLEGVYNDARIKESMY